MSQTTPVALLNIPSPAMKKTLCHDHLEQILKTSNMEIIHHLVLAMRRVYPRVDYTQAPCTVVMLRQPS